MLRRSLIRSRDSVLLPTLSGYLVFWSAMVMRLQLGSDFFGRNVQTTLEKEIDLRQSGGMSSYLMTSEVLVPSTL